MSKKNKKAKGGWLRCCFARKKDNQSTSENRENERRQQEQRQEETKQVKDKVENERNAAVQMQIQDRRAAREGDSTPIEILFEKGKHMHLSPDDRIRDSESVQKAAQTLLKMFLNKGSVLVTQLQQVSETEWAFDADFLNGVLHCTVTRRGEENVARYLMTDWTPEIWQELETTVPAILGAVEIGETVFSAFSILCEVRDADDPQKKILWIENAFGHEKDKHVFAHPLIIHYQDPQQEAQRSAPQDDWNDFNDAVDAYCIFQNDRFPLFYTGGSAGFFGYMFQSWHALAVSANGALYMEAEYDEPWERNAMTSTELTDAFVEDILYAYEQRFGKKMKYALRYDEKEYMGGKYCIMTIEPELRALQGE